MDKRINWLDTAKGIGIILVVLGHISFRPETINVWLCSFHMPLFFLLAGITYNAEKYSDFKVFLNNKAETLVIPYFIFAIISWLWDAAWNVLYLIKDGTELPVNTMVKNAIGIFVQIRTTAYGPGVWFIPCIFVAFILLHFVIKLSLSIPGDSEPPFRRHSTANPL